jgi:hypothetical protein
MQTKMDLLALKSRHFVEITDPEEYLSSEEHVEVFGTKILKYSLPKTNVTCENLPVKGFQLTPSVYTGESFPSCH